jgi:hypothetical protein
VTDPPKKPTPTPGGAEAVRAERAARRAAKVPSPAVADTDAGDPIIKASWAGTALFALSTAVAVIVPDARLAGAVVDLALFLAGCVAFFWCLAVAAERSREREIGLWSLFLLEGVASRRVRQQLLAPLVIQIVIALAAAFVAAPLAFGLLVPIYGLGLGGLWGAKHGVFGPRVVGPRKSPRPSRR